MTETARKAEMATLETELVAALRHHRAAQKQFRAITAAYVQRYGDTTDAEYRAADDPRRQQAIADTAYWRAEAELAATALTALSLSGGAS